jgi:hypothetical protein
MAVMWCAADAWNKQRRLSPAEWKQAFLAADLELEKHPPFLKIEADIPHFGKCSYAKCLAIVSVAIVAAAQTEHVDSPFLAARQAKHLADNETPCGIANLGLDTERFGGETQNDPS